MTPERLIVEDNSKDGGVTGLRLEEARMSDTIVAVWDGSPSSRSALDWAAERARDRGDEVRVIRFLEVSEHQGAGFDDDHRSRAHRELDDEVARISDDAPGVRVRTEVLSGDPLRELHRLSETSALLVVGTPVVESQHIIGGWSLGTRLATTALGTTAVIPEGWDAGGTGIVAGLDRSDASLAAAYFAAREARQHDWPLQLVHAWFAPTVWRRPIEYDDPHLAQIAAEHAEVVSRARARLEIAFPTLQATTLSVNEPAASALLHAKPRPAMIVIGCRGIHSWSRLYSGSVSREVLLNSTVPTLVIGEGAADALIAQYEGDEPRSSAAGSTAAETEKAESTEG
ncbi:universal stress protein [Compostimonas suwonensis]|uniref:Nucleotide-binding universal stress UspA family protein n=1 Tax=Compostimonas suwonensis TaxID=1048394 RepID=A0A2M9C514_9MICO|nr:universal stress protein [Compostimonas suwonensis]PJJ65620.1 nucleotide-binding universal stress UspA family protein [Compostimonas suwonensis]